MRALVGLLWALGGAVIGGLAAGSAMLLVAKLANISNRDGAAGYAVVGVGLLGALAGLIAALVLYARSAPAGQGTTYFGGGALAVVALAGAVVFALWGVTQLRESPVHYDGAMATLELELRARTADLPPADDTTWLRAEVRTGSTRPEATPSWAKRRVEGEFTMIPLFQGPLIRAVGRRIETFAPDLPRTPDPDADWSTWSSPASVSPPFGAAEPATPMSPVFMLRHRVRRYGD